MTLIGDKNIFAIEYNLFPIQNKDEKLWDELQGTFAMYVYNKNICRYSFGDNDFNFNGVMFHLVDWFCENLSNIIGYDPYPLPVEGANLLEIINSANEFETDDDIEEYLWYSSERNWLFRHSWRAVTESIIPSVFFRRCEKMIEVSWNNNFWEHKNVKFLYSFGVELIETEIFRNVVLDFLFNLFSEVDIKYNEDGFIIKDWVHKLQAFTIDNTVIKNIISKCDKATL